MGRNEQPRPSTVIWSKEPLLAGIIIIKWHSLHLVDELNTLKCFKDAVLSQMNQNSGMRDILGDDDIYIFLPAPPWWVSDGQDGGDEWDGWDGRDGGVWGRADNDTGGLWATGW